MGSSFEGIVVSSYKIFGFSEKGRILVDIKYFWPSIVFMHVHVRKNCGNHFLYLNNICVNNMINDVINDVLHSDNLCRRGVITFDLKKKCRRNISTWDLVSKISSRRYFYVKTVFQSELWFVLQNILKFKFQRNL